MLFLDVEGVILFSHSPYSPDLAPCDFWAFPVLKRRIAGQKFDGDDEMKWAVLTEMARMSKEKKGLDHVFDMWEKRLRRVIEVKGDYIEK